MLRKRLLALLFLCLFLPLGASWLTGCDDDDDDSSAGTPAAADDDASPADDDASPTADDDDSSTDDDTDVTPADDDDDDVTPADDDDDDDDDDDNDDNNNDDDDDNDDDATPITLDLIEGCNPFMTSEECLLPYPSAFFQIEDAVSPTGVRNNYPEDCLTIPPLVPPLVMGPTNTADGCPPAGPLLLHFSRDVHADFLNNENQLEKSLAPGNPLALFNMETGKRIVFMSEMDMNRKEAFPDRYAFIIRPLEPMEMGQRHLAVLTNDLTDIDGQPLESPAAFAVLRDGIPVTNEEIEAVRDHYEEIFAFLESHGYPRQNLLLAWDFTVASKDYLLGSVLHIREETLDEVLGIGLGYTIDLIEDDPNQYLARIVEGTFEVPSYLQEDNSIQYDENHHPIRQPENQWYPYTMIIPKKARTLAEPLPLVLFGHGLFGNGRSYLTGWLADELHPLVEETGVIMLATDWIGLSDGDLELIISQVVTNINRIVIVTDRLQQSLINNLTLTELALGQFSSDPDIRVADNELIDPSRLYYYGASLGGIQGSSLVSLSPRFTRGVFSVPGAVWLNMIPRSINWIPIKLVLDLFYPDPLTQQIGIAIIQTQFDLSDPINLTRLLYREPLPDAPADRLVLLQEAIGDCQVPNLSTEMLARAIGAGQTTPPIYPILDLEQLSLPTTVPALTQYYMVEEVQANPPPLTNVPPTVDNGVHFNAAILPHVLQQIEQMMTAGEIEQYCTGLCDPD